jgi:uncharacterized protein (TIGR02646 family)
MRRIIKHEESVLNHLKYKINGNNSNIKQLLLEEQHCICAYTETYLDIVDLEEIEHFNPNLKGTESDNYQNWFLVKAKWNRKKGNKWFETILHPTHPDFEDRIIYQDGQYFAKKSDDIEAHNLIELLMLQDEMLISKRKKYISRLKEEILVYEHSVQDFFDNRMKIYPEDIYFIRAIEAEFQVKINFPK